MSPIVRIQEIAKNYGRDSVFARVSLEIVPHRHFALLGPSGCGKSTILRILAGLEAPDAGEVWIRGRLASGPGRVVTAAHERGIGMVFQDLALWPNLTVEQNVWLGLSGAALPRHERRARVGEALRICGVEALANRKPAAISGGQQQRVALARALAARPQLLCLDEPFSGLDIALKARLHEEIRRLCAQFGVTLILASHDPVDAAALCTDAAVLENGRIREQGPLEDLLQQPASETLQVFAAQLRGRFRSC